MKRRLIALVLVLMLVAGVTLAGRSYFDFVSETIYAESTAHLTEIFHQANQTLYNLVSVNWSRMRMWEPFLKTAASEEDIIQYVSHAQEECNFTNFYFISRNGEYLTLSGKRGYLDLRSQLGDLILKGQPIVANSVVPDKPEIMVFAIPASKSSFQGFDYDAIAITYNNSDLVNALKISAFDGEASTFVALSDGRIVVDNASADMTGIHNFFAFLEDSKACSEEALDTLRWDFLSGNSGSMVFEKDGESYYLVYESANFQKWMVLGVVPTEVVNASMNRLQSVTVTVVSSIVIGVAAMFLMLILWQNRQKLKEKDNELLSRDELFSKLSNNVEDVFLMLDAKALRVDYVSSNIEKLLGISEHQVREEVHILEQLLRVKERTNVLDALSSIRPGTQMEWDREYIHQISGELRWFHVVAFCSDIQGEKKYILDLSDRTNDKKINQALQEAVHTAESANRAKSAFLSSMSHDIRTPMNAIVGFTNLAKANMDDPEKAAGYLDKIQSSSNHLLGLINDVLDMSRIESGKTTLNLTEEKITDIVRDLDTIIRSQAGAKNQTLTISTQGVIHDTVMVDKLRLNQVCMNLLSNAVKYTQPEGRIAFRVRERSASDNTAHYEIQVSDNGYGMTKEFLETIFDSFSREEDSRTSKIQGTGLGMTIAKNLVDLMGGTIHVESEKGVGSTFTVTLPLQICQAEEAALPCADANRATDDGQNTSVLSGKHILAAEDNELNAEILEALLEMAGAHCEIRENGRIALESFLESQPGQYDLILMDVQMPEMNGYQASSAIRKSNHPSAKTIPIIAMTANAFAEDIQNALDAGMNAHIPKPLDMAALEKAVKQLLE